MKVNKKHIIVNCLSYQNFLTEKLKNIPYPLETYLFSQHNFFPQCGTKHMSSKSNYH